MKSPRERRDAVRNKRFLVAATLIGLGTALALCLSVPAGDKPFIAARFTDAGYTNGQFQAQFSGVAGQAYVVEVSSNLNLSQAWSALSTNTGTGGLFSVMDTNLPLPPERFYRAVFSADTGDTQPPQWPLQTLTASEIRTDGLRLSWPPATDDGVIVGYGIYADGQLVAQVAGGTTNVDLGGLLPGREYAFVIEACDEGGNCSTTTVSFTSHTALVQEPPRNPSLGVDENDNPGALLLHSGEFVLERTDVAIRGRRNDFTVRRTYRSGRDVATPLGHGWDADIFMRLEQQPNGDLVCFPGNGRADLYVRQPAGDFAAPAGFYTMLVTNAVGAALRDEHGTVCLFDTAGRLTRREDRVGNGIELLYTNVNGLVSHARDEFGRAVTFTYDGLDRLQRVRDFAGRETVYTYDGSGNLTAVRTPVVTNTVTGNDFPAGKTERYAYDTANPDSRLAHNLLRIIAPNETHDGSLTPRVVNAYGQSGDDYDRVLWRTVGGTNSTGTGAGGTLFYAYDLAPAAAPAGTDSKTTVTDRTGNVTEYYHDASGHCLRALEQPDTHAYTRDFSYNHHGEITEQVQPEGNRVVYVYDAAAAADRFRQGNLLSERHVPDVTRGGTQAAILTTYTYDPLFNRVLTQVEPRGNDAAYLPQNGGVQSAGRYATSNTYDYMEGAVPPAEAAAWGIVIPPALLGAGDVNGDSIVTQQMGNLILEASPSVSLVLSTNQAAEEGAAVQEVETKRQYNRFGQITRLEDARGNIDTYAYYPENDPDGDTLDVTPGRDAATGGYLREETVDAFAGPNRADPLPVVAITQSYTYDAVGNLRQHTDGRGSDHRYVFNALDELIRSEAPKVDPGQPTGYLREHLYDANGNVVTTRVQNVTTDPVTHLPAAGSPPFHEQAVRYDILDNVIERRTDARRDPAVPFSAQPEQLETRYHYDANENVVRVESPLAVGGAQAANVTRFVFDERDLVVGITRGHGATNASTFGFTYDRNENRTAWTDAEDNDAAPGPETHTWTYDGYDRTVVETDRAGNEVHHLYDPGDHLVERGVFGPVDGTNLSPVKLEGTAYRYDELGRLFEVGRELFLPAGVTTSRPIVLADGPLTPADGFVTTRYEYDALGRRTFRIEDDGAVYRKVYDGADRLTRALLPLVDGSGQTNETVVLYDGNDNVTNRLEVHIDGRPVGAGPPALLETIYVYDALDRLVRETDARGFTTYTEYDSRNNTVAVYDGRGAVIADPLGLYAGPINDRGNSARFVYDGIDRLWMTSIEMHLGGQSTNALDTNNPAIPSGVIVTLSEWDANSRLAVETDGNGHTTAYSYDDLNRLVQKTNADGGGRAWTYDRDDNLRILVDENGSVFTTVYDGRDRAVDVTVVPAGTILPGTGLPMLTGTTRQTFEFDGLSRPTRFTDNNDPVNPADDAVTARVYDSLSRVVEDTQNGQPVTTHYNSDDRARCVLPSGHQVDFAYDAHDQAIGVQTTEFQVDTSFMGTCPVPIERESVVPGPGLVLDVECQLDPNKLVQNIDVLAPQSGLPLGVIGQQSVQRNRANQVEGQNVLYTPNLADTMQVGFQWGLSSLGQVRGHDRQRDINSTVVPTVRDTLYGPAQEILDVFDPLAPGFVQQNAFSPTYERTNAPFAYNAGLPVGTGVRTADNQYIYQFDVFDRLRTVRLAASPAVVVQKHFYDACPDIAGGRRVAKWVRNSGPLDGVTRFYYDGHHVVEEASVDTNTWVETLQRRFFYGDRHDDDVVAMDVDTNMDGDPDQLFFYAKDANNNVIHLVDQGGAPAEVYTYDHLQPPEIYDAANLGIGTLPFSPAGNPYFFTGRRFEPETGLYYYRARFFDPQAGEFLQRDPLGAWHDPGNLGNGMAYSGNAFWNGGDPAGLAYTERFNNDISGFDVYEGDKQLGRFYRDKEGFIRCEVKTGNGFQEVSLEMFKYFLKRWGEIYNWGYMDFNSDRTNFGIFKGAYKDPTPPPAPSTQGGGRRRRRRRRTNAAIVGGSTQAPPMPPPKPDPKPKPKVEPRPDPKPDPKGDQEKPTGGSRRRRRRRNVRPVVVTGTGPKTEVLMSYFDYMRLTPEQRTELKKKHKLLLIVGTRGGKRG